jgi:hypothetical protein
MRRAVREPMSRPVWLVLVSWGMGVILISGLLSFWIWKNDRDQDRENARVKREQDQAMCAMLDLFTAGPPPVAGPAGDRGRVILAAMLAYQQVLHCADFRSEPPVTPRPR